MDVLCNSYMPGDSRLVEQLVSELKSQGIFDQFRKECISDVDTKPAYQNLRQRVEGSVTTFLKQQIWSVDLNKNQLREQLRKSIHESGFLETGVERIVDQVVNPKINTVFLPKVEEVVYRFLGVEKPVRIVKKEEKVNITDLLPTDLEAISPESVQSFKNEQKKNDSDLLNESLPSNGNLDEDESPPFEPLHESHKNDTPLDDKMLVDENTRDSHLSGFSGLESHESNHGGDIKIYQMELSNQESQFSLNSSESRLSIITSEETTKMEVCEDLNIDTKADKSNNEIVAKEINKSGEIIEDQNTPNSNKQSENKYDDGAKSINKKNENTEDRKSRSVEKSSKEKRDDKHKKSSSSSSKDKDKSSSRYSSQSKTKDIREKKDSKGASSSRDKDKGKEKLDKDKYDKDKSSKNKEKSEKDKIKSDKTKLEKDSSNKIERDKKEKSEKNKDRSEKGKSDKEKSKNEKDKSNRDKEKLDKDYKISKDKYKEKTDKSSKIKEKSDKENERNSSEKSSKEKSTSSKDRSKGSSSTTKFSSNHEKKTSTSKKESNSQHIYKEKTSNSNSSTSDLKVKYSTEKSKKKETHDKHSNSKNDKERESKKKSRDDHYSSKLKKTDRRSTDRDSNDGQSSKNYFNSCSENTSRSENNSQDFSSSSFTGGSGDSSNSDQVESAGNDSNSTKNNTLADVQKFKYMKPKFALNFEEARKIMKIRKQLAIMERQNQLSLAKIEMPVDSEIAHETFMVEGRIDEEKEINITEEKENINSSEKSINRVEENAIKHFNTETNDRNGHLNEVKEIMTPVESKNLSKEKWEALEAKLSQVMAQVNSNSYESDDDCEFRGYSSTVDVVPKQMLDLSLDLVKKTEMEILNHQPVSNCRELNSNSNNKKQLKYFDKELADCEEDDTSLEKRSNICRAKTPENILLNVDTNVHDKVNNGNENYHNNLTRLSIPLTKSPSSESKEDECYFLEKPTQYEKDCLKYINAMIVKLEKEVKDSVEASKNNFWPLKNGRKRKLEQQVDYKNNDKIVYLETVQKRRRSSSSNTIPPTANKKRLCNNADIMPTEQFSLPLSPAESDKSSDRKDEEILIPTKQKRNFRGYSQRYSSDDLYKPRPILGRRRSKLLKR